MVVSILKQNNNVANNNNNNNNNNDDDDGNDDDDDDEDQSRTSSTPNDDDHDDDDDDHDDDNDNQNDKDNDNNENSMEDDEDEKTTDANNNNNNNNDNDDDNDGINKHKTTKNKKTKQNSNQRTKKKTKTTSTNNTNNTNNSNNNTNTNDTNNTNNNNNNTNKKKWLSRRQAIALKIDCEIAIQKAMDHLKEARELASRAGLTVDSNILPDPTAIAAAAAARLDPNDPNFDPTNATTTNDGNANPTAMLPPPIITAASNWTGGHSNTDHVVTMTGDEKEDRIAELKRNLIRRYRAMQPENRGEDRWDKPRIPGERRRRIVRERDLPQAPPEPPMTGFVIFVGQMTTKIRHDRPNVPHDQSKVVQEISKLWRLGMSDEDRNYYNHFSAQAKNEYERQVVEYRATGSYTPSRYFMTLPGTNVWVRKEMTSDEYDDRNNNNNKYDKYETEQRRKQQQQTSNNNHGTGGAGGVSGAGGGQLQGRNKLEQEICNYEQVIFPKRPPEMDEAYEYRDVRSKFRRKLKLKGLLLPDGTLKDGLDFETLLAEEEQKKQQQQQQQQQQQLLQQQQQQQQSKDDPSSSLSGTSTSATTTITTTATTNNNSGGGGKRQSGIKKATKAKTTTKTPATTTATTTTTTTTTTTCTTPDVATTAKSDLDPNFNVTDKKTDGTKRKRRPSPKKPQQQQQQQQPPQKQQQQQQQKQQKH